MTEPCDIVEGGGGLFTDDLWRCRTCGHEGYPEFFVCPKTNRHPEKRLELLRQGIG